MNVYAKDCLPAGWREVADCVDRYEAACECGLPDLRELAAETAVDYRTAALAELAAVDMEYRWKAGTPKKVEQYLEEFEELRTEARFVEALIAQEYQVRHRCGAQRPSIGEYHDRFARYDVNRILGAEDTCTFTVDSDTPAVRKAPPEAPLATIGRYQVREELGSGAFGRVYRCHDAELNRDVAIKLSHHGRTPADEQRKQFLHEARGAARLHHAGIVAVLDVGKVDDGRCYVVYEYVAGQTLRDRMKTGSYTRQQAIGWCIEIGNALHHAHTHGIVHRDVSPANVLIDGQGHVRLTDFGLAKVDDQYFRDDRGRVLGSLAYISPEQARGESHWASAQSDIYSLGVVLYELLTKRRPFNVERARGLQEILSQVERRVPDPPRTIDETISPELEAICLKAMAKNPADRYTTAADLSAALSMLQVRRRRPFPWLWTGLGSLAMAAGVMMMVMGLVRDPLDEGEPAPLPPPLPELREVRVTVHRPPDVFDLTDEDERRKLPVRDGDQLRFVGELTEPGYVYLLAGYADGAMEVVYPREHAFGEQKKVPKFSYPEPGKGLPVTSEHGRGTDTELLLFAVSNTKLSREELEEFVKARFSPSLDEKVKRRAWVVSPVDPDDHVSGERGFKEPTPLNTEVLGEPLVKRLNEFLETGKLSSYRAVVYPHAAGQQ